MNPLARLSLALKGDHTLGTIMDDLARVHGRRRFVEQPGIGVVTYATAAHTIDGWAGALRDRIAPGDVVALTVPNGVHQFLAALAVSRSGGIPLLVNDRMRDDEIEHLVDRVGARHRVRDVSEFDHGVPLGSVTPVDRDSVAALFATSGTTGSSKAAELTHRGLLGDLPRLGALPSLMAGMDAFTALPVAHIYGFVALLAMATQAMPAYVLSRFDAAEVLGLIERRRPAVFLGVPAMYRLLDEAGAASRNLRSVRIWVSGADVLTPALAARFARYGSSMWIPGVGPVGEAAVVEGYGMVETSGGVAMNVRLPVIGSLIPGSLGIPLPGHRLRVVDDDGHAVPIGGEGELQVHGRGVLSGYRNDAGATTGAMTDDGWLHTGDRARRGAFGTVSFAGRDKDVIKVGGYSVGALSVAEAIEQHPDVIEAAVVGLADAKMGEVPVAAVRVRQGATVDAPTLVAWIAGRVASYEAPRRIIVVDELPRTSTDKIRREAVRALFT